MDPPQCVQNAMMTKDKKPFTYTPGGIDLSEARSPRLQRRIERNANLAGVGDVPQQQIPHPQITGPLPPSTLAAMRPQPQVQVFPSGPAPPAPIKLGGVPPPAPPLKQGIPPPPPPPSGPLPTQKVCTADNQVLERPDMTKIIPDNPMSLLRKTSGPQPRKTLVDMMFEDANKDVPDSPPYQPTQQQNQYQSPPQRSQAIATDRGAPISPVLKQTTKPPQQYQPQLQTQYQPENEQNGQVAQPIQPPYQEPVREQPRYQPPVIERQPAVPRNQSAQPEIKTSNAHLGSLYIPNAGQQQQSQKKIVSPPTPPERNQDVPSVQTPPLREAPRPWQAKKTQEEVPAWAKRDNEVFNNVEEIRKPGPPAAQTYQPQPQYQQQPQPQYQQQQPYRQNHNQQPIGVRIEISTKPRPQQYQNEAETTRPNVVYVTQPLVFQHEAGSGPQGSRVIPIQMESPKISAGNDRNSNRQQNWGNNPSQSNSFKIIQKFTDAEDEYDSIPVTEHSPKFPQNFQQVTRGSQLPSQKGPQVRTIPIQIESNDTYIHPSEQVVPEPKKYTGSSIPSRSFKILQAMTAPDNSANVDDQYEEFPYDEWVYPPPCPPYPYSPYWYEYNHYYCPKNYEEVTNKKTTPPPRGISRSTSPAASGRHTPVPFWGYPPPYYSSSKLNEKGRETPKPTHPSASFKEYRGNEADKTEVPSDYLPFYDPYYYYYYYGYLPMYPPYPYYPSEKETSPNCCSSGDEKNNKTNRKVEMQPKRLNKQTPYSLSKERITPTIDVKEIRKPQIEETESSECETDTETDEEYNHLLINPLKSMKSITNMNTYSSDEDVSKNDEKIDEYLDDSNEDMDDTSSIGCEEEEYPHQLSMILEESERTESRMRTMSALSDSTTLAEESDTEDEVEEVQKELPADIIGEMPKQILQDKVIEILVAEVDDENINEDDDTEVEESDTEGEVEKELPAAISESNEGVEVGNINEEDDKKSDESEDWWGILGKEEDDLPRPKKIQPVIEDTFVKPENNEEYNGRASMDVSKLEDNAESCKQIIISRHTLDETLQNEVNKTLNNEETNEYKAVSRDIDETLQNETNKTLNNEETIEYKVVLRKKKNVSSPENGMKSRPRSIYDSLEDIKTESSGSLVQVDNFVGILEGIQKDFGCFLREGKRNDKTNNRPVSMYEMTKPNEDTSLDEKEKRASFSSFEKYTSEAEENANSSDDDKSINYSKRNNVNVDVTGSSSANYIEYNLSLNTKPVFNDTHITITPEENASEKDEKEEFQLSDEADMKVPSVRDRIQALRESINSKRTKSVEKDVKELVLDKISVNGLKSKPTSSKSSFKSFEESEEDEVDSGVTSDMSRHISDTEEYPELKKLTKYQRAATHSRLFKLLHEECDEESDDPETDQFHKRESLSLNLNERVDVKEPVNIKLVNELIDSLLKLKKGQEFKNLPKEKLYAAAVKILREDREIVDSSSEDLSSFLSPIRSSTGYSTAIQTPLEFANNFDEYKQYYESWNRSDEFGKCPRVLSSKSIHKKLIKLLETSVDPLPVPIKSALETNEVTSVS